MHKKTYSLRLTEREIWYLKNGYEASFTEPDEMNEHERSASNKVNRAWMRAEADKRRGGPAGCMVMMIGTKCSDCDGSGHCLGFKRSER